MARSESDSSEGDSDSDSGSSSESETGSESGSDSGSGSGSDESTSSFHGLSWWDEWKGEPRLAEQRAEELRSHVELERYQEPSSIFDVCDWRTGCVRLLRASFLVALGRRGGVLARNQDLPDHAFLPALTIRDMHASMAARHATSYDSVVPIVAVTAPRVSKDHADPQGVALGAIAAVLEANAPRFSEAGFSEMGVFWDWASVPQVSK